MGRWVPQIKQNREAECIDYTQEPTAEHNLPSMVTSHNEGKVQSKLEKEIMAALQKQGIETESKIKVRVV